MTVKQQINGDANLKTKSTARSKKSLERIDEYEGEGEDSNEPKTYEV